MERLRGHYQNTTWTRRKEPPADWAKPLPEYLQKEYENSFLDLKAREMRGEKVVTPPSFMERSSYCTIM